MTKKKNKISICITCLNSEKTISKTLNSILSQRSKPYEIIICDGFSSDQTYEVIKKYQKKYKKLIKVYQKKDSGISMGFNNTWKRAKGNFLLHLNSDDELKPNAIKRLNILTNKDSDFYVSSLIFKDHKEKIITPHLPNKKVISFRHPRVNHCGLLIKKSAMVKLNGYSSNFKVAMDIEIILRAIKLNYKFYISHVPIAIQNYGGYSSKNSIIGILELYQIECDFYYQNKINFLGKTFLIIILILRIINIAIKKFNL